MKVLSKFDNVWLSFLSIGYGDNRFINITKLVDKYKQMIVYKCYDDILKKNIVIKMIQENYENELEMAKLLIDNPNISDNIVNIIEYKELTSESVLILIMDHYPLGNLKDFINNYYKTENLPPVLIFKIINQINNALNVIHNLDESKQIIHRDVKLENVFVEKFNEIDLYIKVKLGDFGESKIIKQTIIDSLCGTLNYLPPEVCNSTLSVDKSTWSTKADIWSLGVLLFNLITKDFNTSYNHKLYDEHKQFYLINEKITEEYSIFKSIIQSSLSLEYKERSFNTFNLFKDFCNLHYISLYLNRENELYLYCLYYIHLNESNKYTYKTILTLIDNYLNNNISKYDLSHFYHLKGLCNTKLGNYKEAIDNYLDMFNNFKHNSIVHYCFGQFFETLLSNTVSNSIRSKIYKYVTNLAYTVSIKNDPTNTLYKTTLIKFKSKIKIIETINKNNTVFKDHEIYALNKYLELLNQLDKKNAIYLSKELNNLNIIKTKSESLVSFSNNFIHYSSFGKYGYDAGQFYGSNDIKIDYKDNLILIADYYNYRIQAFDLQGNYQFQIKTPHHPSFIAIDNFKGGKEILIGCAVHNKIYRFEKKQDGKKLQTIGNLFKDAFTIYNGGMIVDPNTGNIYVSDYGYNRIKVYSNDGKLLNAFNYVVKHPGALDFNSKGQLVVIDYGKSRILTLDLNGNIISIIQHKEYTYSPWGLAVDKTNDNIYVGDCKKKIIIVFNKDGEFLMKYNNGEFTDINAIALNNNDGKLYICDKYSIQIFK